MVAIVNRTKAPQPLGFSVVEAARNIHVVEMDASSLDWRQDFLLSSDRHHDNPKSDHDLEREHLDEAVERRAGVLDFGDIFDAMCGRDDPRRSAALLRREHAMQSAYFDSLIEHNSEFYGQWARNFVLLTPGNHEKTVEEKQGTDLTERLAQAMSIRSGVKVHRGGYGGWVVFRVNYHNKRMSLHMHYFHGSGGGGMMSFDSLRVRRNASYIPDADIVVGGHVHESWHIPLARERLLTSGPIRVSRDLQHHVRCGTYKDAYGDGFGGWDVERGHPPKPKGAVWMTLRVVRRRDGGSDTVSLVPEFRLAVS